MQRLDWKALGLTCGLLWGGCILLVGLLATLRGPQDGSIYGKEFLLLMASVYPGYDGLPTLGQSLLGGLWGFCDGAVGGALLAALYNCFSGAARRAA